MANDSTLIRKCLDGRVEAYGNLVDRYSSRIVNLAFAMTGDRHEAEDIAQEAFVRAFKGLAKFRKQAKFSSWLYQIALNLCKDRLKSRSRRARSVEESLLASVGDDPCKRAPRVLSRGEISLRMNEAIASLPYLYRVSFALRHLQGLSYAKVSEITGATADTIRVRAYRAREMLRELLSPVVDTYWKELAAKEKGRRRKGAV